MATWDESRKIDKISSLIGDKRNLEKAIRQLGWAHDNWDKSKTLMFVAKKPFPYLVGRGIDIDFGDFSADVRTKMVDAFRDTLLAEKNRIENEILKLMNGDTNGR